MNIGAVLGTQKNDMVFKQQHHLLFLFVCNEVFSFVSEKSSN